jgi:TetR/AcrR family transcriptional regulator, cholesterol catabolism regulator
MARPKVTVVRRSYRANDPTSTDPEEWPPAKTQIYEAAVELFWRSGIAATSMQDIASHAGVSKGAIYHYFSSKEELLRICTARAVELTLPAARATAAKSISATEAMREIIAEIIEAIDRYSREISLFFEQWSPGGASNRLPEAADKREEYESIVVGIIERGVAAGEFRPLAPPRVLAFALFGLTTHARLWWRPDGPISADDLSQFYADLFLSGLLVT